MREDRIASALQWVGELLGLPEQTQEAMAPLIAAGGTKIPDFGLEFHHDGSGRVDLSVFTESEPRRTLSAAGVVFDLSDNDVVEYDLIEGSVHEAGVFHHVTSGALPGWSKPDLVAVLNGRGGQVRMLLPIADERAFDQLLDQLERAGVHGAERLRPARRLIVSPVSLRLGVEYFPDGGTFGPRLGLEVIVDPATYDVSKPLSELGVDAAPIVELAGKLPKARAIPRGIPELGLRLPARLERATYFHFSLAWPDSQSMPVLKSYVMVAIQPAPDPRDSAVRAVALNWTERLNRASRQLPMLRQLPDAEEKMQAWAEVVDPQGRDVFELRLSRNELDRQSAPAVLAFAATRDIPWWPAYELIISASTNEPDAQAWFDSVDAALPAGAQRLPFVHVWWPVVQLVWQQWQQEHPELAATLTTNARQQLCMGLAVRLSSASSPALSELMWRDLPFGAQLIARIGPEGNQSRQRYTEFCHSQLQERFAELFTQFPMLGKALALRVEQWLETTTEMLQRIAGDRADLFEEFGVPVYAPITAAQMGAGDTHNNGRCVTVLEFDTVKVVYKPRSVRLEQLYLEVAQRVPVCAAKALARGDEYGYAQFIENLQCPAVQMADFYRNAGRVLAVLHVLGGTDCHQENLIAHGDELVLIDGETLLSSAQSPVSSGHQDDADPLWVMRIGMLPSWLWLDGRRTALDMTALGVGPGGDPIKYTGWKAVNTDAMVRAQKEGPQPHPTSLPTPDGQPAPLVEHVDQLQEGFAQAYRLLAQGRDTWLPEMLSRYATTANRAVLRPTYVYAELVRQLAEPDALRSPFAQAMVLEQLTRAHLDDSNSTWPLVAAEQASLERGDVPYFQWSLTGGGTQWHDGELAGWPAQDQLAENLERITRLGEQDLQLQLALIEASIQASSFRMVQDTEERVRSVEPTARPPDTELVARRCMQRVADGALQARSGPTWLGLSLLPNGIQANLLPIGAGLYDGRMGLALGMLMWARAVPQDRDVAESICADMMDSLVDAVAEEGFVQRFMVMQGPGLTGVGGMLRGLDVMSALGYPQPQVQEALLAALTPQFLKRDRRLDLTAGAASLIAPLVRATDSDTTGLIRTAAGVLLEQQDKDTGAWFTLPSSSPITGVAHGAAGIAVAMAEAGVALGDEQLIDAAVRGMAYEAGTFDPQVGNWPDFREMPDEQRDSRFMLGWCAGAPGIALSRMRMLELLPDHPDAGRWRKEMARGAQTTATSPLLSRDHLCCGNLGRVSILRTLAARTGDRQWDAHANGIVKGVVSRPGEELPRSMLGNADSPLPVPGFFTGLPGMAAVLLGADEAVARLLL